MAKRAVFWLGLIAAIAAFAVANGWTEYHIARSARTYIVVNGVERDLTSDELVSNFLIRDTIRAIPIGIVVVGLLCFPLIVAARWLHSLPRAVGYLSAVVVGAAVGGFLSFILWVLLGGWGPPLLWPSVAAGALLTPALLAARSG